MEFSKELLEKVKAVKTVEELKTLAIANGIELTDEQAEAYFAKMHQTGEMADDELDNVSGGCGVSDTSSIPVTSIYNGAPCRSCGSNETNYYPDKGKTVYCANCGKFLGVFQKPGTGN